ncbi:hypothetical protein DdX_20615 [Ditylenchus destructor]|uniref:Uncharacterized protein n=1 Tax=Ditylenchus destructor TaxID=166010 RepID=A0AAD4MGB1_9BILA|nr:hypothetical protein DdX_20615 [Ditylenchus destructor]
MRNSSVYSFDAVRLNVVPFQLTSSNCNFGFVFTATEMTQMFEAGKKVTGTLKAQPTVNNDDVQNVKPDIYVQLQAKVMSSSIPADTKQEGLKVYFDRSGEHASTLTFSVQPYQFQCVSHGCGQKFETESEHKTLQRNAHQ